MLGFGDAAIDALRRYRWPGNVRELQNSSSAPWSWPRRDLGLQEFAESSRRGAGIGRTRRRPVAHPGLSKRPERQIILNARKGIRGIAMPPPKPLDMNRTTLYKKMKRLGLEDGHSEAPPRTTSSTGPMPTGIV